MEWILTHFYQLTTVLLTIIVIRAGLYPQQTRYFFSRLPHYLKQWAQWMDRPWPILIGRYQVAYISPIIVLGWVYQACIAMLIILVILQALIGSLYVIFSGLSAYRMILGCFLSGAMVCTLYRIRRLP